MEGGDEEEILLVHHLQAAVEVEVVGIYLQVDAIKIQHLRAAKKEDHGADKTVINLFINKSLFLKEDFLSENNCFSTIFTKILLTLLYNGILKLSKIFKKRPINVLFDISNFSKIVFNAKMLYHKIFFS